MCDNADKKKNTLAPQMTLASSLKRQINKLTLCLWEKEHLFLSHQIKLPACNIMRTKFPSNLSSATIKAWICSPQRSIMVCFFHYYSLLQILRELLYWFPYWFCCLVTCWTNDSLPPNLFNNLNLISNDVPVTVWSHTDEWDGKQRRLWIVWNLYLVITKRYVWNDEFCWVQ